MKYAETITSNTQQTATGLVGIAPALQELLVQDEFAALRETLAIYAEVLCERAM